MHETFLTSEEIKNTELQKEEGEEKRALSEESLHSDGISPSRANNEEKKEEIKYNNASLSMNNDTNKKYDFPAEESLNPNEMPILSETGKEGGMEGYVATNLYKNMIGEVLKPILAKDMTPEELELLDGIDKEEENMTAKKEVDYSAIATERYKPDSLWARIIAGPPEEDYVITPEMKAEQAAEAHKYLFPNGEEGEGKEALPPVQAVEVLRKHLESQMSVFTRARDIMLGFLEKNPKLAKLSIIGTLAVELANATPAMANGDMERMIRMGVEGVERSVYTQMEGGQRAGYAQASGRERAVFAAAQAQQRAQFEYQREMQNAEQTRQSRYMQLDNNIIQWRSQGQQDQGRIGREVYARRMQIEQEYANRVANAQMRFQATEQEAYMRQQDIQMQTQMRQQEIQMQTQMNQQRVMVNTGARVFGAAVSGVLHGAFHH
jgi:hypothetical protein